MRRGAVFFDLDGTLVDYESCQSEALEEIYRRLASGAQFTREQFLETYHRVHRADEAAQLTGAMSADALLDRRGRWRRVLEQLGTQDPSLAAALGDEYERARRENTRAFPGALETLGWLRSQGDLWLGVVTEGSGENQRRQLARLGFADLLDDVLASSEVGLHKPDPALMRMALARANATPSQSASVGDRPLWDLAPAKSIGLCTVFLRSGRYAHELVEKPWCADAIVSDHASLLRWLQDWAARLTLPSASR